MSDAQTGADLQAGGQGQNAEEPQRRSGLNGEPAEGASVPAEAESPHPCQQRLPAAATRSPGPLV